MEVDLAGANLDEAVLSIAKLFGAGCKGVDIVNANGPDLAGAILE